MASKNEPHAKRRGWLKNGNRVGDFAKAKRCGARTKGTKAPCKAPAMKNGRCRMHGGKSTGPRTKQGLENSQKARLRHGWYSREMQQAKANLKALLEEFV